MYVCGSFSGKETPTRKFRIGATVVADQLVIKDASGLGEVGTPHAKTFYRAVGVTFEAGTYAASSPGVLVKCSYGPDQLIRGKVSGGTAVDTAWTTAQILTNTSSSTTVISCTAVGTLDYIGGYMVALDGTAKGDVRTVGTQVDNTTITNSVPFSAAIAVGGTVFRTFGFTCRGAECTTNFVQFNNLLDGTETMDDIATGASVIYDVIFDGHSLVGVTKVQVVNPTAPKVEFIVTLADGAFRYQT